MNMKKLIALLLAVILVLTACGPADPTTSDVSDVPSVSQSTSQQPAGEGSTTGTDTTGTGSTGVGTNNDSSTPSGGSSQTVTTTTTRNSSNNGGGSGTPTGNNGGGSNTPSGNTGNNNGGGANTPTATTKPTIKLEASEVAWYQTIVDSENAWLASMQLTNGAFPMTPTTSGTVKVTPYFSDFAALSLLNQADKYAFYVKRYMSWHFSHLNTAATDYNGVDGTIYDYNITVNNGTVVSEAILTSGGKKSYDSTDSYAATFLMVLQKYVEKTGDKAYILEHKAEIDRIVNAMFATMVNGLTLAKPDYRIKYLMDNCEVYEGMLAGAKLYSDVIVPANASAASTRDKLKNGAKQVADRIEKEMWTGSYYHPALGEDSGVAWNFAWSNYYPSATSQTFLIIHGLLDPASDRAQMLYKKFCESYAWENFSIPDTFYWGSNVYTAALMGDVNRVKAYMTKYEKIMKRHAYPLYNADAAKVCMAAYLMTQMG